MYLQKNESPPKICHQFWELPGPQGSKSIEVSAWGTELHQDIKGRGGKSLLLSEYEPSDQAWMNRSRGVKDPGLQLIVVLTYFKLHHLVPSELEH